MCNDDGMCECRDNKCGDQVCSEEGVDGECVECRADSIDNCDEFQVCIDGNVCGCENDLCPQFLACDVEDETGVCNQIVRCKVDEDCPSGGICINNGNDDVDLTDNICDCTTASCDAYETEVNDGFNYVCRGQNAASEQENFEDICVVASTCGNNGIGVFGDNTICPEGYSCIPRNRDDRDDDDAADG